MTRSYKNHLRISSRSFYFNVVISRRIYLVSILESNFKNYVGIYLRIKSTTYRSSFKSLYFNKYNIDDNGFLLRRAI